MIETQGNWELAKALRPNDNAQMGWRKAEEWNIANAKAAELRAEGFSVSITANADGRPVTTVTSIGHSGGNKWAS